MFVKPDNWDQLSPEEKKKIRLDYWESSEGLVFASPEAEARYRERIHRLRNAIDLNGTDRIISNPSVGSYALRRAGLTGYDMVYNYDKFFDPIMEFNNEFQPDLAINGFPYPGPVFDILGLQTYVWSGQKLSKECDIQAVEGEYMMADEYADFIMDPSGFWLKTYLPRMCSALEPLRKMPDLPRISEIVDLGGAVLPFGMPDVQEMLKKLMEAGNEAMRWISTMGKLGGALAAAGFPSLSSVFWKVPFDFLGDTLRGTKGIMTDMYRRPKDVLAACEAYVPILVSGITKACDAMGAPVAMAPLHKGADGFMSQEQFETFYWPTFKAVMLGLWEEGIVSFLFAEGGYNSRLETIAEMPKGSTVWWFDQTDMRRAKEALEGRACIQGNVPASLMTTGTVEQLRAYCEDLLEVYSDSAGFILANGAGVDKTTDEHVRTMIEIVRQ